jgi:DNA-directed RNA polymerase beta subunit
MNIISTKSTNKVINKSKMSSKLLNNETKSKSKKISKVIEFDVKEDIKLKEEDITPKVVLPKEVIKDVFNISDDKYIEAPWTIIGAYFQDKHLERLVRHQLESYNNFVGYQLPQTIEMFNDVHIKSENDFDKESGKYALEIFIKFENFHIYRPQIHENNGAIKLMFPQEARLRNFTYASAMTIDINIKYIVRNGENLNNTSTFYKVLSKIHIGKLPIMLKSNICVLSQYKYVDNQHTGDCRHDAGGYFIINGSEKTVLGQERAAENRVYCFNISKNNTKYNWSAEVKSVPDFKCISPKQINMMISSKNNGFGNPIVVEIPRVRQPIPLFIVFRALGVISDKEICEYILLNIEFDKYSNMLHNLQASIIEANKCIDKESAIRFIMGYVIYTPINMDKETGAKKKYEFTLDVLQNDLFPHCITIQKKIYFLGYMALKLMKAHFEWIKADDRDSYLNKRVDLTGSSLNNLFRNYFNKLVKDMEKQIIKEINNGSWRSTEDYTSIINLTNIYKIVKSTTIENGFKRALATGDFGIKHANTNKVGVAQVLSRLTYVSSLSHLRRISTPTDKSGKLVPPRKLHNTSWGFLCPAECFDPETPILMWDGTSKRAGDIMIDDILVDDLGNPTKVRTTCSGFKNMYDIIPDKDNFMRHRVTDNHILTLRIRQHKNILNCDRKDRKYKHSVKFLNRDTIKIQERYFASLKEAEDFVNSFDDDDTLDITIENYLKLNQTTKDHLVLFKVEGIHWPKKDVEMDPYLLGLWLGDGLSIGSGFALNYKTDFETLAYWENWAQENGAIITKDQRYGFSIISNKNKEAASAGLCNRVEEAPLKKYLRKYNLLNNKHIPNEYLTNDRETRLKVLAGLIDTDGSVRAEGREIRICQGPANYRIIEDAYTLAMSLGFSCGVKEGRSQWTDEKSGDKKFSTYKELTITGHKIYEIPTLLPRKKLVPIENKTQLLRSKSFMSSKFNLLEVGIGPYVGWQLHDKRGRFCLIDGLAVHNTPEGASVGIVKNLSYMSHVTIYSNSRSLYDYIEPHITSIEQLKPIDMFDKVKVFINGSWIGITEAANELYMMLKEMKVKGIINIYTSIIFDYKLGEIRVCNDSGRLTRPVLRVKNNNILLTNKILDDLTNNVISWDDLFTDCKLENAVLEYIDPEEQNLSMIATKPHDLLPGVNTKHTYHFTHCEIHPSTIFGIVSSCIPFPEHNQSPRNTYQCLDIDESVLLSNGNKIAIKNVKIGDEVVCFNPLNPSELSNTRVVNHFIIPNNNPVFEICLRQGKKIIATDDHKFMTLDGWCEVKNMKIHYTFIAILKENKIIYDVVYQITKVSDRLVADITVESENHSFITTGGILSSNCAQAKQAMGVYATNYNERMDKTAYVLNYPTRPLVDTRVMNLIQLNKIPSGCNINVAIMTHTGYNQEDSVLINKGSIDRGLFQTTIYHTEKDEDKQKINGDEEIRCKPDQTKTKGMKFGNYDKVNSKGVIPENTLVENRDVIIAKVTPIKENRNDHTKVIKFDDQSKLYRTVEETYIDKNYIDRNGDGYSFAKVRLRTTRKPVIGDKFCALPTQQVLTDKGWIEIKDIDITVHKVATLDVNGNMCYEFPTAKYEYDHDDKMYYIKNKQLHIVCTLNHKLYVKRRAGKKYELIEAQDVMGKVVRFQKTMTNVYPDTEFIQLGDEQYKMDDWLQLLGMFIADGSCDTINKYIHITALKERKIAFNKHYLEALNVEYKYSKDGNFIINSRIYPGIYEALSVLSLGALNKYLPEYVWNLSQRQSKILLESLLQGDGSSVEYKGETFDRYGTISIQLANDITRLALHCGYSGIVKVAEEPTGIARIGKRTLGSRAGQEISVTQQHTYYKVSIITKQNEPWINKKVNDSNEEKLIDYQGKVYCIEVPSSHTYYMRENAHSPCLIIGNSSRHGQKGTVGNIIPEEDMPFTSKGDRPDIIINPHAIPSRMTIGQLKETLLGKVLIELGLFGDGTSFGELNVSSISEQLLALGYEAHGNELMYNGLTGEQIECNVFMGPVFYQRLKHMVNDKQHSRSIGPMVNLTRQPAEGRSRDGGLRFGEMEKDAMVSHGAAKFTRGRMYDASDKYSVHICKKCGLVASYNDKEHIHHCRTCDNRSDFAYVEIPYACKLLFQELTTMNVVPRVMTDH